MKFIFSTFIRLEGIALFLVHHISDSRGWLMTMNTDDGDIAMVEQFEHVPYREDDHTDKSNDINDAESDLHNYQHDGYVEHIMPNMYTIKSPRNIVTQ